ncbi:MAG: peptidoglycan DD-metalloendopeptidase family protein [Chloroflexi bacterium]|nr:peptidoglycan DD-metalloendopeptidase family protein [Chloroflexota bacterium]
MPGRLILLLLLCILLVAACGSDDGDDTEPINAASNQATQDSLSTAIAHQREQPSATPLLVSASTDTPVPPSATATLDAELNVTAVAQIFPTASHTPEDNLEGTVAATQVAAVSPQDLMGNHFWLVRPIIATGNLVDYGAAAYRFGSTGGGRYAIHHGIDMMNPEGTIVIASAGGRVLFAGHDFTTKLFGPRENFYGNHVVIEHAVNLPDTGQPFTFYTLYGHMSQVYVATGDIVRQNQEIGAVGMTGVAIGPHLHFEVRLGDPEDYTNVYNPDLWLQPFQGNGVLAGRATTTSGDMLQEVEIQVVSLNGNRTYRTYTYVGDEVKTDPFYRENFVLPDLPVGEYEVRVGYLGRVAYRQPITIEPLKTVYLSIQID